MTTSKPRSTTGWDKPVLFSIRQQKHRLRPWLLVATALLLLSSIALAGHNHHSDHDKQAQYHCTLCHHSNHHTALPVSLLSPVLLPAPAIISRVYKPAAPRKANCSHTSIRAPPAHLHTV
ncbi:hypothetical protein [Teredinibacter waterburyi]|uniref:hypothetical protein n=1 Tax=Teredinibacter waterburyi TaxID=1500538 RepID=UPI00165F8310|nr:hypothetical protein [Teredinibacter waterburyi]